MHRRWIFAAPAVWLLALMVGVGAHETGDASGQTPQRPGWTIPAGGDKEPNPLSVNEAVIGNGRKLYAAKCQRCQGPGGLGDGPDADKARQPDMDLTAAARAARNPDGMVFYKVWNGRATPKMPAFSEELSREQAWAIVAYVQTLRVKK